jgi:predicted signal transduction protein with EAL and GGDEF domain
MHIFDEIHAQQLDRRQLQLTVLASLTIAVLATGVALLMYPAIFTREILFSSRSLEFSFYGFCLLSVLLVGYLWDRQLTIRRLTQQVRIEQRRNNDLRLKASNDVLNMIPGIRGFREQLSAHSARTDRKVATLSVAVVRLYLSGMIAHKLEEQIAFADAAQVIHRRLRKEDSIWTLSPGVYGLILSGMDALTAKRLAANVELGLQDAAGVNARFTAEIQLLTFADRPASAREIEQAVAELLPRELAALPD